MLISVIVLLLLSDGLLILSGRYQSKLDAFLSLFAAKNLICGPERVKTLQTQLVSSPQSQLCFTALPFASPFPFACVCVCGGVCVVCASCVHVCLSVYVCLWSHLTSFLETR